MLFEGHFEVISDCYDHFWPIIIALHLDKVKKISKIGFSKNIFLENVWSNVVLYIWPQANDLWVTSTYK